MLWSSKINQNSSEAEGRFPAQPSKWSGCFSKDAATNLFKVTRWTICQSCYSDGATQNVRKWHSESFLGPRKGSNGCHDIFYQYCIDIIVSAKLITNPWAIVSDVTGLMDSEGKVISCC